MVRKSDCYLDTFDTANAVGLGREVVGAGGEGQEGWERGGRSPSLFDASHSFLVVIPPIRRLCYPFYH